MLTLLLLWYLLAPIVILLIVRPFIPRKESPTVSEMTGIEFEEYVAQIFRKKGYSVLTTPKTGDFGADLILTRPSERICVQCKCYKSPVGVSAVQEIVAAQSYYRCERALVVTNSTFTQAAHKLAMSNRVILCDGHWLKQQ